MDLFILRLNMMRDRAEQMDAVAYGTRSALERFLAAERAEPYIDEGAGGHGWEGTQGYKWRKVFRKGGPLEWYNGDLKEFNALPTREEHLARAARGYDESLAILHKAEDTP